MSETSHFGTFHPSLEQQLRKFFNDFLQQKEISSSEFNAYYAQVAIATANAHIKLGREVNSNNLKEINPDLFKIFYSLEKGELAVKVGNEYGAKALNHYKDAPSNDLHAFSACKAQSCEINRV